MSIEVLKIILIIVSIYIIGIVVNYAVKQKQETDKNNYSTIEKTSSKKANTGNTFQQTNHSGSSFVIKVPNGDLIKEIDKLTERGLNSDKISTVKNNFESLRILHSLHASTASSYTQRYMEKSISEIKGYLSALLIGKWEETARKRLENFEMAYSSFLESDFPDLATATRAKNSCLHHYDSFWDAKRSFENEYGHCLQNYDVWEYARQEMTELLRCYDRNFVFWDSPNYNNGNTVRKQLEIKLTKKVDTHRPEYKRKTAIYKELLSIVEKEAPLYRSQLLKMVENYDSKEVAAAYRYLVKKDKLYEYKVGNRFFVDLSDKEKRLRAKSFY